MIILHYAFKYKKWLIFLIIAVMVLSISIYIYSLIRNRIDTALILDDALQNTADSILKKINSSASVKNISDTSFTLKLEQVYGDGDFFSELSVVNDKKNKQLAADIKDCRYGKDGKFSLSVFADNERIGFYVNDSPEYCYTAKSKNFRTKWNKSIYSYFYHIPSFCPDDMTYNRLNSLMTADNIIKALMAFGIGETDINASDFLYNIKIKDMGEAVLTDSIGDKRGQHIRLTLSGKYCAEFIDKLSQSSAIARQSFVSSYVELFGENIKLLKSDDIVIEFVIADNLLYSAETSLEFDNKFINIHLNFSPYSISISTCDLYAKDIFGSANSLEFDINIDEKPRAVISDNKTILAAAYINRDDDNGCEISFTFLDNNSTPRLFRLIMSTGIDRQFRKPKGKNIYSLTLFDIYELYNEIRDYPDGTG